MSSAQTHRVYKWSPQTNITTVVAGRENTEGPMSYSLNSSEGIYVEGSNGTVYVADYGNISIQKWLKNALDGTTVAGLNTGEAGSDHESLSDPTAVWIDDETQVVTNKFDQPADLAFDDNGNLYVCDCFYDRVVMFTTIHNEPCFPTSAVRGSASVGLKSITPPTGKPATSV
ncbi:unnamed protein product [Rotaria sp. Silwood2]|nr:unnamed protein product [Rotaria sp. Silwood2]CAF4265378.1 unnamed protein product [Rotaria sp. Silwood2]